MLGASQILVTDVVLDEVTKAGHADKASSVVAKTDWLVRTSSPPLPASVIEWDLGPGESSVIATTLQHANACSVIDDLNGRKCARALGVRVMGTIGIVIMAHRLGMIEDLNHTPPCTVANRSHARCGTGRAGTRGLLHPHHDAPLHALGPKRTPRSSSTFRFWASYGHRLRKPRRKRIPPAGIRPRQRASKMRASDRHPSHAATLRRRRS